MNIEDLEILKELSEQTYFGDLPFLYYADLIGKLLTAYEKEKEKNKKIEKELEKYIKFCEQEAEGSLNNEICHISLKFNKRLLDIINEEE